MTTQNPETISSELIDKLNEARNKASVSEFELRLFRAEAEKLLKISPAEGYTAYGAIASIICDVGGIHDNYEKAINLHKYNADIMMSYSVALSTVYLFEEAAEKALLALEYDPLDVDCLDMAIRKSFFSGQFKKAIELVGECNKRKIECQGIKRDDIFDTHAFALQHEIDESLILSILETAGKVIRSHGKHASDNYMMLYPVNDEESSWLHYSMLIPASIDEIVDISMDFADALADERFPPEQTSKFIVSIEADERGMLDEVS